MCLFIIPVLAWVPQVSREFGRSQCSIPRRLACEGVAFVLRSCTGSLLGGNPDSRSLGTLKLAAGLQGTRCSRAAPASEDRPRDSSREPWSVDVSSGRIWPRRGAPQKGTALSSAFSQLVRESRATADTVVPPKACAWEV